MSPGGPAAVLTAAKVLEVDQEASSLTVTLVSWWATTDSLHPEGSDYDEEQAGERGNDANVLGNGYTNADLVKPPEWHFTEGETVLGPSSIMGVVTRMQSTAVEIEIADGPVWCRWYDIVKYYELGNYVEVVGGEMRGRHGFVQGVNDENFIDIMEGHSSKGQRDLLVHRNLARIIPPPTVSNTFVLPPEEMAKKMHTGPVPWHRIQILVLPAAAQSKKRRFDHLNKPSHLGREADVHKGKVGTVLDVGINQATASGLSVCVRLEQTYSAVHAYQAVWVDYDEVVEETTPITIVSATALQSAGFPTISGVLFTS
ncbi:hypothetical protein F5146DRAFT_1130531 [Armillaria mellea]|nr:hypothetical protein F5146DRAFT_1130526 [Armillaria mellea]KAK0197665.1 hypothetical protein F5146DRAFT_1130531 [Armillaria mellea]